MRIHKIDSYLLLIYVSLLFIGWLALYSTSGASSSIEMDAINFKSSFGKQTIYIFISLVVFFFIQYLPKRLWGSLSWIFYILAILSLIAVLIIGSDVKGAQSWFKLGPISIQPSEFAKLAVFLSLATLMSNISVNVKNTINRAVANMVILLPLILVLLQPDAGSGIVFLSCFLVLYREGYSPNMLILACILACIFILTLKFSIFSVILYLIFGLNGYWFFQIKNNKHLRWIYIVLVACSIPMAYYGFTIHLILFHMLLSLILAFYLIVCQKDHAIIISTAIFALLMIMYSYSIGFIFHNFLQEHQQARIIVWLDASKGDPQGSLYNLLQSKMAIGSGSLWGKGYLQGNLTQLNYIPEQNTDFIFSGIAEQFGFIGSVFLISLFIFLILRLIFLAEKQKSQFSRIYMLCISCCIFTHFFINMGMTMGLVPVIGIPLPFISYGGTALLSFSIMLAIACALDDTKDGKKPVLI